MPRTKQSARKSTGGKAPPRQRQTSANQESHDDRNKAREKDNKNDDVKTDTPLQEQTSNFFMETGVLKHKRTTLERAEKFISKLYFTDVNLLGRLYPEKTAVGSIHHWAAPTDRYTPYEEAVKQTYTEAKVGQPFGPTWATHWFKVEVKVPKAWKGREVRLRWNSNSEALVWEQGKPVQGLCSDYDRLDFPLTEFLKEGKLSYTVYIEMACNGMFGAGDNGMITAPNPNKQFTLSCCEVAVFDRRVYNLVREVEMLHDMAKNLPEESGRGYEALYTVNSMINACDVFNTESFERCHTIAEGFLKQKNGDSQHTVYAMGHAHIDTAWLWPYSETKRKCARSWSCTIRLMEKYPEFTFTCSQAQQYEWVKDQYPLLYADMKKYIAQGRFIPVGGTWVEMDGLIPGGEACVRQFLYGQRFFQKEFGIKCKEFWLPDTFGYSGQLPQIMRHCGISRFLTQKMSWSLVNKFPHHTFWWEGISRDAVLAHFPPGDSYEMKGNVQEVLRTANNFKDKGRSNKSAFLFGFGDGGNGPSEDMLERLGRMHNVDGLPKVKMSTPDEFFSAIERDDAQNLCRWRGELYLELHNGTYTTHARVKKMNRHCEFKLHDLEFVHSVAFALNTDHSYPHESLDKLWKLLLLNQFHDVLPGSSIGMVYEDAHKYYHEIMVTGENLFTNGCHAVTKQPDSEADSTKGHLIWNTQSFDRSEVVTIPTRGQHDGPLNKKQKTSKSEMSDALQTDRDGNALYYVNIDSYGFRALTKQTLSFKSVTIEKKANYFKLQNSHLTAHVDRQGRVVEMYMAGSDRNAIDPTYPANQFVLYDDVPLYWDAWDVMDYHMETGKPVRTVISEAEIVEKGPLRSSLKVSLQISAHSSITQYISLDTETPYLRFKTEVSWHENRKMLKVEFPTSVHTREATYDIQFGHIKRGNHRNTSWDTARFEVCGHKWSDLSEHGFGVSVLNDSKYGHSALDNVLRMSLLRSPKAPDNMADMETHTFTYALMPHHGSFQEADLNKHSYCLNNPLILQQQHEDKTRATLSVFKMSSNQVILETVKKSEDDKALILRFYESFGGTCTVTMTTMLKFKQVQVVNGIEDDIDMRPGLNLTHSDGSVHFTLRAFQIISLKLLL